MELKSIRILVLLVVLFFVAVVAYLQRMDHMGGGDSTAAKSQYEINHLDALSSKNIVNFRNQFLRLRQNQVAWPSLPEASNDSLWVKDQQRRLHFVLQDALFDVIVLPIQQASISFDKTARIMAARFVADDIRQRTQWDVMPVEFVHKLLGENNFQYSDSNVSTLQERYKAKQVVSLYLRDDWVNKEKLFLVGVLQSGSKILKTHYIHIEKPTDERSLSSLISGETPKLVTKLFDQGRQVEVVESDSNLDFSLPESFESITTTNTPIETALHFQLLGLLTSSEQRLEERTRYFERSLLALRRASKEVPELRVLKARALFHLYRRPEAVSLLASPKSLEEKAFLAFLNGNYYDLKNHVDQMTPNLFRALSSIELRQLADLYEITMTDEVFDWIDEPWKYLVGYAASGADRWDTRSNSVFFDSLKGLFPKFDIEYGNATIANFSMDQLTDGNSNEDLLFETTISKLIKSDRSNFCCSYDEGAISELDILKFYRTLGLGNILRGLEKKINLQHLKESTSDMFDSTSSLLEGDHTYTRLKVESLRNEIERSAHSDHPKLLQSLVDNALAVIFGSGGSNLDIYWVREIFWDHLSQYQVYFDFDKSVEWTIDRDKGDWPGNLILVNHAEDSHSYEYTHSHFPLLLHAHKYAKPGIEKDKLFEELKTRFDGHPDKTAYLSRVLESEGDKDGAIQTLRKAVDSDENSWEVYNKLAKIYLKEGNYIEATNAYLKYPNFSVKDPQNSVLLSNRAYEAGSHSYWKGEYELAEPLYEIAANLKTGSHASLTSAQRLAYIKNDYVTAVLYARRAATRYASYYRYRDFLALLHLFGFSEDADVAFQELAPRSEEPYIWSALFVGHRKKSSSNEKIAKEIESYLSINEHHLDQAKRYIVMQTRVDRRITDQDIESFSTLEKHSKLYANQPLIGIDRQSLAAHLLPNLEKLLSNYEIKGLSFAQTDRIQCNEDHIGCYKFDDEQVPSRHQLFLQAYRDFQAGSYEAALDNFVHFDIYYTIGEHIKTLGSEVLPYVAMVASKLDRSNDINRYLSNYYENRDVDTFDYRLSKAIIEASLDKFPEAVEHLNKAFILMPYTENRATFTWYQLVEVCEWLFNSTGDNRFLKMALNWMEDFQVIHPIHAWSYAFEAKYSDSEFRKLRALAIADFLDSDSNWLHGISEEKKLRAREWLIENNPFDLTKHIEAQEQI